MIAVRHVQETNLAWALIEAVKPQLNLLERNYVFVTTGAGDTFSAIRHLLKLIVAKGIPLRPSLVQLCVTWLESYAFHDDEEYLRRLIEGFLLPDAVQTAVCVKPLLTAARRTEAFPVNHAVSYAGGCALTSSGQVALSGTQGVPAMDSPPV